MRSTMVIRSNLLAVFLLVFGPGWTGAGQTAQAEQPAQEAPNDEHVAPTRTSMVPKAKGKNEEELEDEVGELDPLLRLQLLSAILIVGDVSTVTRSPFTETQSNFEGTPVIEGHSGGGGGTTPHAPEPASLVLGIVGTSLALLTSVVRRRRRKMVVAE